MKKGIKKRPVKKKNLQKPLKKKKQQSAAMMKCPRCGIGASPNDEMTMMGRKCWHCGGFYG